MWGDNKQELTLNVQKTKTKSTRMTTWNQIIKRQTRK